MAVETSVGAVKDVVVLLFHVFNYLIFSVFSVFYESHNNEINYLRLIYIFVFI